MKILSLVLSGYKRLTIRGVNSFAYHPTHPHQLIIGTNGSGKSSVLAELSPLPITPSSYHKDGFKEIELEHRGALYRLKSTIVGSHAKHSFVKNAIELNDGGTGTVQKILVEQEFDITPETFDVLTGKTRFTAMSSPARRAWIMRLSGDNLDYAMRVFQDIRTKHRDTQAILKHTQKRLAEENRKIVEGMDVTFLQEKANQLKEEITNLMGELDKPQQRSDAIITQMQQESKRLVAALNSYIEFNASKIVWHGCDHGSVINLKTISLNRYREKVTEHYTKIRKLEEVITTVAGGNFQSSETTKHEMEKLEQSIANYKSTLYYAHGNINNITRYTSAYYGIHQTLIDLFMVFLDNSDKRFNRESRDHTRVKIEGLKLSLAKLRKVIGDTEHRLDHISTQKDIQCPKCDHHWKPGIYHGETTSLQHNLTKAQTQYNTLEKELIEAEHFMENVMIYSGQWSHWSSIMSSNPQYAVLWNAVTERLHGGFSPINCITVFHEWFNDCKTFDMISGLYEKITEHRAMMLRVEEVGYASKAQYDSLLNHHHAELEECLTEIEVLEKELAELVSSKNLTTQLDVLTSTIVERHRDVTTLYSAYVVALRTEMLKEDIYAKQSVLAQHEYQLGEFKAIHNVVSDLQQTEETVLEDLNAYSILMTTLSPVDGLIADQLKGFVSAFVEEINLVLSAIWTHDFTVHPCGLESGELDYKFPITCHGADIKIADVAHGSSSQVDVVDFAFRLVVMRMLGLNDYPLYLDELAPSLDEQHRINIMTFVKQYVEMGRCSQMFMISHYDSSHFTFAGAEVCVMDSSNILNMPDVYNQHVAFG